MIRPLPCRSITLPTAWQQKKSAFRLISRTKSHSFLGHLFRGLVYVHPGDVGQDIDLAHLFHRGFDHALDLVAMGQVDLENQTAPLLGLNLVFERQQFLVGEIDSHDIRAISGKTKGDFPADPLRSARDEGDLPL